MGQSFFLPNRLPWGKPPRRRNCYKKYKASARGAAKHKEKKEWKVFYTVLALALATRN